MKIILKYVDMYCGECDEYMHVGNKTAKCMNKHCREYKVKYILPAIEVEPVEVTDSSVAGKIARECWGLFNPYQMIPCTSPVSQQA